MMALLFAMIGYTCLGPDLPLNSVDLTRTYHSVDYQSSRLPKALREDAIYVTVTRNGRIFIGEDLIDADQLAERIRNAVHPGSEIRVYLKADAHTKYQNVAEGVDQVRLSGVQNVSILTEWR